MADDLQINSLDRFRKHPGRLVLEQHGGCEVPAGCGGVILRWRNPLAKVPLIFNCYTPGRATFFVDGEEVETHRIDLAPGVHVLAGVMPEADLSRELLMAAAVHTPKTNPRGPTPDVVEAQFQLASSGDATWKFVLDEPGDDAWMNASFDDQHWLSLEQMADPELQREDDNYYAWYRCNRLGARCLGLPANLRQLHPSGPKGGVWIRKVFEIPVPQMQTPTPK
jgi:hypothetical protein